MRYSNIRRAWCARSSIQLGALSLVTTLVGAIMLVGCAANNGNDTGSGGGSGNNTQPVVRACGHFTSSTTRSTNSGPGNSNSNGGPKGIAIRILNSTPSTWSSRQNRIYCLDVARSGSVGATDLAAAIVRAIAVEATHDGHPLNGVNISTVNNNPIRFKLTSNSGNTFQIVLLNDNLGEVFQSRGSVVFTSKNCTAECNHSAVKNPTTITITDGSASTTDFVVPATTTSEFEITVNGLK